MHAVIAEDAFALLGQPRRPWLDPIALQDAFHRRSAVSHPDVATPHESDHDFPALNAAYTTLANPKTRLRHLLTLEFPHLESTHSVPPSTLGDLFLKVAAALHSLNAFERKAAAASSKLAQALLTAERIGLAERLHSVFQELEASHAAALEALKALDDTWDPALSETGQRLATLHSEIGFVSKWLEQTREGLLRLQG